MQIEGKTALSTNHKGRAGGEKKAAAKYLIDTYVTEYVCLRQPDQVRATFFRNSQFLFFVVVSYSV